MRHGRFRLTRVVPSCLPGQRIVHSLDLVRCWKHDVQLNIRLTTSRAPLRNSPSPNLCRQGVRWICPNARHVCRGREVRGGRSVPRCTVDLCRQGVRWICPNAGHSSALCLRATTQRSLRTAKQPPARRIRCKVRLITPLLRCATGRTLASSSLCRIDGKPGHHPARGPGDHGGHFRGVCVAFVRAMGSGWLHGPPHSHSPAQAGTDRVFIIKCSYLEIYNEVRRGETEATAHGPPSHWPRRRCRPSRIFCLTALM